MKKKLIIFDLDGVLINSLPNMKKALKLTSKKLYLKLSFKKYLSWSTSCQTNSSWNWWTGRSRVSLSSVQYVQCVTFTLG